MSDLTYLDVGLTQHFAWPAGFRPLRHRILVGQGERSFQQLANGILTFNLHRGAGLQVAADSRAAVGSLVVVAFGVGKFRLEAPCEVVWVEESDNDDGARRAGFGYGTLPGHPERGEEAFIAELTEEGSVHFEVRAFSRHANWFYQLGAPVARSCQWLATRGYLHAARQLAAASPEPS